MLRRVAKKFAATDAAVASAYRQRPSRKCSRNINYNPPEASVSLDEHYPFGTLETLIERPDNFDGLNNPFLGADERSAFVMTQKWKRYVVEKADGVRLDLDPAVESAHAPRLKRKQSTSNYDRYSALGFRLSDYEPYRFVAKRSDSLTTKYTVAWSKLP